MSVFELEILTLRRAYPARRVQSVNVPAVGGRLTVLARHQPMVCGVNAGDMQVVNETGQTETWRLSHSLLTVMEDRATLLADQAEPVTPASAPVR